MTIYSYIDTLLQKWSEWNSVFMQEQMISLPSDLNEVLGTSGSDSGSRAKEMYRIGLLKKELSTGNKAFLDLKSDINIQSDLGFISALIYNGYTKHPNNEKLIKAYASLSAIFSVIQSETIKDKDFSINTIVIRLLDLYPCPNNIGILTWIRWITSCFYSEYELYPDKYYNYFSYNSNSIPSISVLEKDKDKNIHNRFTFSSVNDIENAIISKGSLTNIIKQKSGLFLTGENGNNMPKGYYGIAYTYFSEFLRACYEVEKSKDLSSYFNKLYSESEDSLKSDVLNTLNIIAEKNEDLKIQYNKIMKNIEEGAVEALMSITGKPKSAFINNWRPSPELKGDNSTLDFLTALRTKPFLLLAGISGTGKSQKVQELAFMSCPECLIDKDSTTPGNYCLVEVKPNWHDSTELLGYYSALSGKYELTKFIRFAYKAIQNPQYPFFLCLDEMNLAPVEQYFAEYLSVLETRKCTENGIMTQPLLPKDVFANCLLKGIVQKQKVGYVIDGEEYEEKPLYTVEDAKVISYLKENGLHLPNNLFVIGTVNMDDTTHQFSRKVIDRAFTIEMNGGRMSEMFSEKSKCLLEYRQEPISLDAFRSEFVKAYEVLEDERFSKYSQKISSTIPTLLGDSDGSEDGGDSINGILKNTPFRVSYRVQNELVLYLSVLIQNAGFPDEIDNLISEATLAILLEKVLPRIQGEQKQLETQGGKSNILKDLKKFVSDHFKYEPKEGETPINNPLYDKVMKKLEEMDCKLTGYYTNFF